MKKENLSEELMKEALKEAQKSLKQNEVPVGAIICSGGKIIARAHNKKEKKHCAIYHAEILAIKKASKKIKDWRLNDCVMYVTLEPCAMCAGAILSSRISKVYIGAMQDKTGCCGSVMNLLNNEKFDTFCEIQTGILKDECLDILQKFFKNRR